jgi:serine protease inhibitor
MGKALLASLPGDIVVVMSKHRCALVCGLLGIAACASPDVITARKLPAAIQDDAAAVVAANNRFAVDLLGAQPPGNAIFSPFSISTALAMLDAGAAGQTDAQLRDALHFTLPGDRVHAAYGALLASLDTGRSYGDYTLATADRLFGQQGLSFQRAFLATTKDDYHAELEPIDFAGAPESAGTTIDRWVADQTDGEIRELFPPGAIDSSTRLVLANAIVFKGSWDHPFDRRQTEIGRFHVAGGADVSTPLMHASLPIAMGPMPGGTLGVLPFRGKDLALLVFLPNDPDGLPQLEAQLTGDAIAYAVATAPTSEEPNDVTLPKFALAQNQTLSSTLASLGITAAFDPVLADFSGIDGDRDLVLQSVVHDARITVDEAGAVALGATGVTVVIKSLPPSLAVDHSFAFAIYDQVTRSILFLGRVLDPTSP